MALSGCAANQPTEVTQPTQPTRASGPAAASPEAASTLTSGPRDDRVTGTLSGDRARASSVSTQVLASRRQVKGLRIAGRAAKTGYERTAKFGAAWLDVDANGCRTRDDILVRDLTEERKRDRCVVVSGTLRDPYTARTFVFHKAEAAAIQIDHMVPLSLAWQLGAQQWSQGKRVTFANDPLNLLAVDGATNGAKSDSGPDSWLPPAKAYRCTYVMRFTRVVSAYSLRLTASMRDAVNRQLDRCSIVYGTPVTMRALPATLWDRAGQLGGVRTPAARTRPGAPASAADPLTETACPASHPVKGNDGSTAQIYHVPGGTYYDVTKPERCFATPAQAEAAGYRAPLR